MLSVSGFQAVGDEGMNGEKGERTGEGAVGGGVKRKPRTDRWSRKSAGLRNAQAHARAQTTDVINVGIADTSRLESTENIDG